jgi:Na+-transporting methylmalonyl-CoA/oxaloacetate decarboxylase beta subunit
VGIVPVIITVLAAIEEREVRAIGEQVVTKEAGEAKYFALLVLVLLLLNPLLLPSAVKHHRSELTLARS